MDGDQPKNAPPDRETLAAALLDASSDRLMLVDAEGMVRVLNSAAAEGLGVSTGEAVGRSVCGLQAAEGAVERMGRVRKVLHRTG